jgi:hypothetical protein
MKIVSIIITFIIISCANSQSLSEPSLKRDFKRISTPKLLVPPEDSNVILLKMTFNGAIPKSRLSNVNIQDITTISLVYSKYKLNDLFDQMALNAQRTEKLFTLLPELRNNKNIQWYWIEQTGCHNPENCTDYFHGFIINLKSKKESDLKETEIALFDYYVKMYEGKEDSKTMDSLIEVKKLNLTKVCDTVIVRNILKHNRMPKIHGLKDIDKSKLLKYLKNEQFDSGSYTLHLLMDKKGKLEFAQEYERPTKDKKVLDFLNKNLHLTSARYRNKKIPSHIKLVIYKSNWKFKIDAFWEPILPNNEIFKIDQFTFQETKHIKCEYIDTSIKKSVTMNYSYTTPDLILKVFDRNKQWKNCLIATDVTGSMYPYLAQFQMWHKLHLKANSGNHDFVFFNDGDNAPDHTKITGKVGGIYYLNTFNYMDLEDKMKLAMRKGGGGDGPENNIEAVIEGLKNNPNCKEVIMIADNWATPRDLQLLDSIKVPIRLVLCGTQFNGINTAYLDMIRKNKGSIHTIEKDLYDLSKLLEGQSFELEGKTYKLKNGQFVLDK